MTVMPGKLDLTIIRGARFNMRLLFKNKTTQVPLDFTGLNARAHFRRTKESLNTLLKIDTLGEGGLILGGAAGTIDFDVGGTLTTLMKAASGVWDLELYFTEDNVYRLLEGVATMDGEVTR